MIKIKDGYAKLIGASALGAANRLLLSNGGDKDVSDFASAESLNNYLPLTGGTITGGSGMYTPLTITNNIGEVWLKFQDTVGNTYIGSDKGQPSVYIEDDRNYLLLHTGNYFNYSLPLSGNNLNSPITGDVYFAYQKSIAFTASNGTLQGALGMDDYFNPIWWTGNGTYTIFHSGNLKNLSDLNNDLYWANIQIKSSIDTTTVPTFGGITDTPYIRSNTTDGYFVGNRTSGAGTDDNGLMLATYGGTPIGLYTKGTERIRIQPNGQVGIGTTTPNAELHVNGSILNSGTIISNDYHLVYNCGSYSKVTSSVTGAIVIQLPITSSQYDMVNVEISVYEYNSLAASKIIVGGHPWQGAWYNHSCSIIGAYNRGVRLGIYQGQWSIILGTSSTVWNYPGVFVTHIGTIYDDHSSAYLSKCTFSVVTNESGFSALVTPTNVVKATSAHISTYLRTQYYDSTTDWYDTYLFYTKWATRNSGSVLDLKCDGYQVRADIAKILNTARNIYGNNFDGSADIGNNAVGSMKYLLFRNLANDGHAGYIGRGSSSSNNLEFQNYISDGKIILAAGGKYNHLEIAANGNIGIGVSPSYKFDVYSTSTTASYDLHYYNSNKKCSLFVGSDLFWYGNAKTSNLAIFNVQAGTISDGSGGKSVFKILGDGNVIASTFVGNLSGKASTANMISHSTYCYSTNVMKNTITAETIFGENATENYLFPSFMEAHPKWSGYADVINFTGYCKWGGTQFAAQYDALNPRVAIRKFNQSRSNWGDWTEFITENNNYKVRDSGNSNEITFYYSTGGLTSNPSWLAAWNGYKLTYVAPSVLKVIYATNSVYLYSSTSAYTYDSSNPYYARLRWNTNSDDRWYFSVYPETPKAIAVDHSYNSDKLGGYNANTYFAYRGWDTAPGKDANAATMGSNFSYSNNCPYTGALLTFACGGYDLQFSSSYGSAGYLAFRTKNGDSSTWNAWTDLAIASNYVAKAGDTMTGSLTFSLPSSNRRIGIIGTYDPNRAAAIWSMGSSYQIAADGTSFGNLYGAAYAYFDSGYTFGANYSIGHSFVWCQNGTVSVALGTNIWTVGNCYAAHFYENSDIRYKTIINNLAIKANQLANLPLFDFKWLDNEDLLNTGTSAQAVQELLPYIVSGTDKLTLDYGVLGTIAGITACRELTEQEKEINELKEQIKFLKDEINNLKTNKLWQS